jgi:hypothetical protein
MKKLLLLNPVLCAIFIVQLPTPGVGLIKLKLSGGNYGWRKIYTKER